LSQKNRSIKSVTIYSLGFFVFVLFSMFPFIATASNIDAEMGLFLYGQGQYVEAAKKFEAALNREPGNPDALKYLPLCRQSIENARSSVSYAENRDKAINDELNKFHAIKELEQEYAQHTKGQQAVTSHPPARTVRQTLASALNAETVSEAKMLEAFGDEDIAPQKSVDDRSFSSKQKEYQETKPEEVMVHGKVRAGFGFETSGGGEFIWKRANFDLNEKNYRLLSGDQLNQRINTYDPAIYSQMKFDVDIEPIGNPFSFHTNIALDPWSYVGKSKKMTLRDSGALGTWTDYADVQILYAGNSAYTMGLNADTLYVGDLMSIPELKVVNGHVASTSLNTKFGNKLLLPDTKLNMWFQPVRELWVDYEPNDTIKLQVFPFGLEDKALSSDDPLRLSNNRTWWEESPWLANWKPGHVNAGAIPVDFTKGEWNDDLAFATRDSEGNRLTALRGFSANFSKENTEILATVASPKTLWQDYDVFDALATSVRAKQSFSEQFYVGITDNAHLGFINQDLDAYNIVTSVDSGLMISPSSKVSAQYAFSYLQQDLTNDFYDSQQRGSAYDLQLMKTSSYLEGADQDYFLIKPEDGQSTFYKTRLRLSRMDKGFQSSLSTYLETRDDEFWGRHLTFRDPVSFQTISSDDINAFRIGNGIDYDRYVANWRTDLSFWDAKLKGLADIRNVHQASTNKYVETVARTEWGWQPNSRFETKMLLLAHHVPRTTGGFDPYMTRLDGGQMANAAIPDNEDANLYTTSLGLKYWLTDWVAWSGIWERTNDFTVAADNFPRGILNDTSTITNSSYGRIYRSDYNFLYSQGFFSLPPYEYHNIFRTGLDFRPNDKWNIYLDYTRNPNEFAGPIDDNMNHVGLAVSYMPTANLQMYTKYTWSRWNSLTKLLDLDSLGNNRGEIDFQSHHNFFFETQYLLRDESKITASYGVGPSIYTGYATGTPYIGSSTPTVDTQHIIRLFYTKYF